MQRRLDLFWPLTFIAAGVMWILIELGRVPASNLWVLVTLWPLLLIGAGLGMILRPYWQYAGAVISVLVVGALFLAVLFAGQLGWNRLPSYVFSGNNVFGTSAERGSGHVITQTRPVADFSALHVAFPGNVVVRQGTAESLTIEAEDNVAADIRTQVVNHVLVIDSVRDRKQFIDATKPITITVTVKDLTEVNFDSAGQVTVQDLKTDAFKALLNGAGGLTFNNVKLRSLTATLSGVGNLQASGVTDSLVVQVDGLGNFDGKNLQSQDATVTLDGLGNATVWAVSSLKAEVNGLGSVSYYGTPQVTKAVNGLGNVNSLGSK